MSASHYTNRARWALNYILLQVSFQVPYVTIVFLDIHLI